MTDDKLSSSNQGKPEPVPISPTRPAAQSARTRIRPAGASSTSSVTGSRIGSIPVSSSTVTTQIVLLPDMAG